MISFPLVSEEVKSIKFDNFDNSHNSFLWPEYFIDFLMWKMDPMLDCNNRLLFTLPSRDSKLQYKTCLHFWNNFPCITYLTYTPSHMHTNIYDYEFQNIKYMCIYILLCVYIYIIYMCVLYICVRFLFSFKVT